MGESPRNLGRGSTSEIPKQKGVVWFLATLASADFGQHMSLPFLDIFSQQVQPVVQTGLNAHVAGHAEGCRCAVKKGLCLPRVLYFPAFTLSPALSQGRQDPGPLS